MSIWHDFHFLRPAWLVLVPVLVYVLWRLWRHDPGRGFWQRICDPALVPHLVVDTAFETRRRRLFPVAIGGLFSIVALAGPTYERLAQPVFRDQAGLVILLDLSASMNAADVAPSRLARARFKVKDLLAARRGGQTALVVFAAEAFTVSPLTDDVHTIDSQLAILAPDLMPSQGSNVPGAIRKGVDLLKHAGFTHGDLLLITDSVAPPALAAARANLGANYRLSVLGIGTPEGAPIPRQDGGYVTTPDGAIVVAKLDAGPMATLAQQNRGIYQVATVDNTDVDALQAFFAAQRDRGDAQATDFRAQQWREIGPWFLLPVLACAVLAFRRGTLVVLTLAIGVAHPFAAHAGWWVTPDQAGRRAFDAQDYSTAAQRFAQPDWRAAAQYRAEDFKGAVQTLRDAKIPEALYNKANALARLGRFEDAISTYDEALKAAPEHTDARYNRDLLRKALEQEQQDKQKPQEQPKEDQSQQQQAGGGKQDDAQDKSQQPQQQSGEEGRSDDTKSQTSNDDRNDAEQQGKRQTEQKRDHGDSERANAADTTKDDQAQAEQRADSEASGDPEKALATEQWLRQIPDDPGGLLRRKFQYQYSRMRERGPESTEPW